MALDFAATMFNAQQLVPDLRIQGMQDEQMQWQREDRAVAQQQARQAQEMQGAYQQELEQTLLSGNPQDVIRLMARFPQMRESIAPLYEAMDEQQRRRDLTQIGSIYANAQAGNYDRATAILQERITADGANADPQDRAILAGLQSSDPVERNAAMATVGIMLAAATGDDFSATYGRLNPTEAKPAVQREYEWRVQQFGQAAADEWRATQDIRLFPVDGVGIYDARDFARSTGGGDPVSGGGAAPATGAPAGPSLSTEQFRATIDRLGPERAARWTQENYLPVRVRSVQEAERLPVGTRYLTPDGQEFIR